MIYNSTSAFHLLHKVQYQIIYIVKQKNKSLIWIKIINTQPTHQLSKIVGLLRFAPTNETMSRRNRSLINGADSFVSFLIRISENQITAHETIQIGCRAGS